MHYLIIILAALSFPAFSEQSQWYLGDWKIVEARFPGITAMTDQEAAAWVGLTIHYTSNTIELLDATCHEPNYVSKTIDSEELFPRNRLALQTLDINTPVVEIIDVNCTESWMGPGFTIIKKDNSSGYIFWDGAYFFITKENQ